ncbi:MAG: MYXO-CTERM sorting domain-containing protein, partial [Myxococcota bacterium]
ARRRQKALAQQEGLHSGDLAGGFSDGASGDGNSQSDSPKSKGCGCGSSGDGPDAAMGLLVVCTLWMRRRRGWHEVHVMC